MSELHNRGIQAQVIVEHHKWLTEAQPIPESLERLSSPERLDQLMQVVSPKSWLPLWAPWWWW